MTTKETAEPHSAYREDSGELLLLLNPNHASKLNHAPAKRIDWNQIDEDHAGPFRD